MTPTCGPRQKNKHIPVTLIRVQFYGFFFQNFRGLLMFRHIVSVPISLGSGLRGAQIVLTAVVIQFLEYMSVFTSKSGRISE